MMVSALIEREQADAAFPIRDGVFVAVVGPSGAGKDTIIDYARRRFLGRGEVEFARRTITRPCDGSSEQHDTLSEAAFAKAEAAGAFALSWKAHGLSYGIPVSVDAAISDGHVVIANASRGAVEALRRRYMNVVIVEITASPDVLAGRLAARGRESRDEVLARLARDMPLASEGAGIVSIDNSGPSEAAGEKFVSIVRKAIALSDVSGAV